MKSIRNKFVLIMIGCILICSFAISAIGILGIDNISNENSETIMKLQASTSAQSLEKLFSSVELAMNTCNDYAVSRFYCFAQKALDFHVEKCYNFCNISADNQNDISGRGAL